MMEGERNLRAEPYLDMKGLSKHGVNSNAQNKPRTGENILNFPQGTRLSGEECDSDNLLSGSYMSAMSKYERDS
jgi:1-acyl-sn-glycerol-3-phosphate acyltransferase